MAELALIFSIISLVSNALLIGLMSAKATGVVSIPRISFAKEKIKPKMPGEKDHIPGI